MPIWGAVEVRHQTIHHALLNKQFYQNGATVNLSSSKPSGVDKLNGYRHAGDTAILSNESKWGVFRTGIWYDWATRTVIRSRPIL